MPVGLIAEKSIGPAAVCATADGRTERTCRMQRRGFTLVEALLACCLIGLAAGITGARLAGLADAGAVRVATADVLAALDAARGAAARLSTSVVLVEDGDRRVALATALADTTPVWTGPTGARHGVAVAGLDRAIVFGPDGIATGASNRTMTLTRGGARKTLVISRLGRIR
jgi:Tfp pilus assembly protein FimT